MYSPQEIRVKVFSTYAPKADQNITRPVPLASSQSRAWRGISKRQSTSRETRPKGKLIQISALFRPIDNSTNDASIYSVIAKLERV